MATTELARVVTARTVDEVVRALGAAPGRARVVAGGTDLTLALRRGEPVPDVFVTVAGVGELREIRETADGLRVGAAVTMAELEGSPLVARRYTALAEAAGTVGGGQIRNAATVGGNACHASPGADTPPALLALGAWADIAGPGGRRRLPLERFFLGPGRTALDPAEVLVAFELPRPAAAGGSAYLRLAPRDALDLAIVGVAAAVELEAGGAVRAARLGLGAVAPTPVLASAAAARLLGGQAGAGRIAAAAEAAAAACRPIDDVRASADYRRAMVRVLVRRAVGAAVARAGRAA